MCVCVLNYFCRGYGFEVKESGDVWVLSRQTFLTDTAAHYYSQANQKLARSGSRSVSIGDHTYTQPASQFFDQFILKGLLWLHLAGVEMPKIKSCARLE